MHIERATTIYTQSKLDIGELDISVYDFIFRIEIMKALFILWWSYTQLFCRSYSL